MLSNGFYEKNSVIIIWSFTLSSLSRAKPMHSRAEGCEFEASLNVSDITTMDVWLQEWQQGSLCFIISWLNALLPATLNQCHSYYTLKFNPGKLVLTVNRLNAGSLRQRRLLLFEHEVMQTWDQKPLLSISGGFPAFHISDIRTFVFKGVQNVRNCESVSLFGNK